MFSVRSVVRRTRSPMPGFSSIRWVPRLRRRARRPGLLAVVGVPPGQTGMSGRLNVRVRTDPWHGGSGFRRSPASGAPQLFGSVLVGGDAGRTEQVPVRAEGVDARFDLGEVFEAYQIGGELFGVGTQRRADRQGRCGDSSAEVSRLGPIRAVTLGQAPGGGAAPPVVHLY